MLNANSIETTIETNNTALGAEALKGSTNPINNSGFNNTALGAKALFGNSYGENNSANGYMALYTNTGGYQNTANGTYSLWSNTIGSNNTTNGYQALFSNITGANNTALGSNAALNGNHNNSTFLGASINISTDRNNVSVIGYNVQDGQCTADDQVLLGNTSISEIRAQVTGITAYSDSRMKTNVKENVPGLNFINRLKPVTYNEDPQILHRIWGTPDSVISKIDHSQIKSKRFIGFLAQEVETAAQQSDFDFPGIDIPQNSNEVYSLRYTDFIVPLVKAVQEQQAMINQQNSEIIELKKILQQQQAQISALVDLNVDKKSSK